MSAMAAKRSEIHTDRAHHHHPTFGVPTIKKIDFVDTYTYNYTSMQPGKHASNGRCAGLLSAVNACCQHI
jgi:hypothetical protein